jgi:hypothetical protein
MAFSLLLDSETQDYVFADGNLAVGPAVETMMYQRLATPRLGWMLSTDPSYGSNLYRFTATRIAVTPILLQQDFFIALQPMVSLGQISNLTVQFTGYASDGAWLFTIGAKDTMGRAIEFAYPYYKAAI